LLDWSRIRGCVFLIGLLPAIIGLAVVIAQIAAKSQAACTAMLKAAHAADKAVFPQGPAIITLLVRAFLIRDTADLKGMELQVLEFRRALSKSKRDKLKREYDMAEAKATKTIEEHAAHTGQNEKSKEDEFMEHYQDVVSKVCSTLDLVTDPATALADTANQIDSIARAGARVAQREAQQRGEERIQEGIQQALSEGVHLEEAALERLAAARAQTVDFDGSTGSSTLPNATAPAQGGALGTALTASGRPGDGTSGANDPATGSGS
jgi:hypothetical protein